MKLTWCIGEMTVDWSRGLHVGDLLTIHSKPPTYVRLIQVDVELPGLFVVTGDSPAWRIVLFGHRAWRSMKMTKNYAVGWLVRLAVIWEMGKRDFRVTPTLRNIYLVDRICKKFERKEQ